MEQTALGAAERILSALTRATDHLVHNRPGLVTPDPTTPIGVRWEWATTHAQPDGTVLVQKIAKTGHRTTRTPVGALIRNAAGVPEVRSPEGRLIGRYQPAGFLPEAVAWIYRQAAEVWRVDHEFAARWASWAFAQDNRDLKVILAALLLVQSRRGDPVLDSNGNALFLDEDYRAVGEAMVLLQPKTGHLDARMLNRIGDLLELPEVAAINRELGFGVSGRRPPLGRYPRVVEKWLRHREANPALLEGLIRAGLRRQVLRLARRIGYRPTSARFFEITRWKQKQAADGRRTIGLDQVLAPATSWAGLTETQIGDRIVAEHPSWKRIVGLLPKEIGLSRAVVAAAIEAGCLSGTDLLLISPTLEELGLLAVPALRSRWEAALAAATNQRAAHVATRMRSRDGQEALAAAADAATQKAFAEVTRGLRVYVVVDKSGSMERALETAKRYLAQFLQGFPLDRTHVSVFNTVGTPITLRHASAAGVEAAFRGHTASGGTDYAQGVLAAIVNHLPAADEDPLFLFVGDQQAVPFPSVFEALRVRPAAFGFLYVPGIMGSHERAVEETARILGIPCFRIEESTFADPYAVTRTLRHLIAATPVARERAFVPERRSTLIEQILATPILEKPGWA